MFQFETYASYFIITQYLFSIWYISQRFRKCIQCLLWSTWIESLTEGLRNAKLSGNERMNSDSSASQSDFLTFQDEYKTSWYHFGIYNGLRLLQMIVGLIGNGLTLKVIWNLKELENGHILMTYSTVSNLLVSCIVPYETFTALMGVMGKDNWKTLCTWQDAVYICANGFSVIAHFFMSVDRWNYFV